MFIEFMTSAGAIWSRYQRTVIIISLQEVIKRPLKGQHTSDLIMANSSQFSPLNTLSDQLGPNSWVSSVFIIVFNANIGKHFS